MTLKLGALKDLSGMSEKLIPVVYSTKKVTIFGGKTEKLPAWFQKHDWGVAIDYHRSSFLPDDLGMTDLDVVQQSFTIKVSGPARALMECLYLAPEKQELTECYQLMENLITSDPISFSRSSKNVSPSK